MRLCARLVIGACAFHAGLSARATYAVADDVPLPAEPAPVVDAIPPDDAPATDAASPPASEPTAEPPPDSAPDPAKKPKAKKEKKTKKKKRDASSVGARGRKRRGDGDGWFLPWKLGSSGGVMSGEGPLRETAATLGVTAEITPTFRRGMAELAGAFALADRETLGGDLEERTGKAELELTLRTSNRLRISLSAQGRATWRPDWPDLYQPRADGTLGPTDRFSHLDGSAGATLAAIPIAHWHARVALEAVHRDYVTDATYTPTRPTHIPPKDHVELSAKSQLRYFGDGWKAGAGIDVGYRRYESIFARDAGTGLTHAGAGGPPPNPLYRVASFEPQLEGDLDLAGGAGEIDASYGYEIVNDTFQGYYTYRGHHPKVKVRWRVGPLELAAKTELAWRTYGKDSYAVGTNHPALTYGDRRVDRRWSAGLALRCPVTRTLAIVGDIDYAIRRTNFPDYVPGVYPDTQAYDIAWNYQNIAATAGVEFHP